LKKSTVRITKEAYKRIKDIVTASDLEVSMLCEVEVENNALCITKVHIPKQTRSAAYTKITNEGIFELLQNPDADASKLKCWIHSHVNMGVSPSGQDESQAEELMNDAEWFIRGIFNKKGEYSLTVHWKGLEASATLVIDEEATDLEAVKKEIEDATVPSVIHYRSPISEQSTIMFTPSYSRKRDKRGFPKDIVKMQDALDELGLPYEDIGSFIATTNSYAEDDEKVFLMYRQYLLQVAKTDMFR